MERIEVQDPGNEHDIEELWVFLSVDEQGRKGIVGSQINNVHMPMVTATQKPDVLDAMKKVAQTLSQQTGKRIHLYRFLRLRDPTWKTGEQ